MSRKVRGGRDVLTRLRDGLRTIRQLAIEIHGEATRDPTIVREASIDIRQEIADIESLISDELDPMLDRRERRDGDRDEDDIEALRTRVDRLAALVEQITADRPGNRVVPIRRAE